MLPENNAAHGVLVDALFHRLHLLDLVLVGLVAGYLVFVLVRFGRAHRARYLPGDSARAAAGVLGVALTAFVIVDGSAFIGSVRALDDALWNFAIPEDHPHTTRIQINAQQWGWNVRYPGVDGRFGSPDDVVLWNELRAPVDAPVYVQLAASDVVHSLYLPHFRQKMDAVPGLVSRLWFQPLAEGTFEMACAEHCGVHHYRMRGVVRITSRQAFDAWIAAGSALAAQGYDPENPAADWSWPWRTSW